MPYHWVGKDVKQSGYDDMVLVPKISEQAIFDNLKKRFLDNYIYTYIGPVLIALNPYREMPYFTQKEIEQYKGATQIENPPHIYALADAMYRNMLIDNENQCAIISGESGAGKTVSAKYIMNYVSKISGGTTTRVQQTKDIILQSNPLLEAFGNAKTLRNNNSSRFGKYVEIQFSRGGEPLGGKITNFLLEKSRVIGQMKNERSFHIFYQLCTYKNEKLHKSLGIQQVSRFNYLSKSGCYTVDDIDDSKEFNDVLNAMKVINISEANQEQIFRLLAGILHLGNVNFAEDSTHHAILQDEKFLEYPCYLFGVNKELLKTKLTSRVLEARGEKIDSTFNTQKAEYARDALAKAAYSRLFDYLVEEINRAMRNSQTDLLNIGILDIYGFEVFDKNGFEQFCINYVNEKLQQIFIELTLKAEQEEYRQENIKWNDIQFFNNKVVCELIEDKNPPGIFSICDDVVFTMHATGEGADPTLLQKLQASFGTHKHFSSNAHGFIVKHYAGDVNYTIDGFCEKNRDSLYQDLIDLMKSSSSQFIKNLFPDEQTGTVSKRPTTAGNKIKTQANQLVDRLMKCYPHYIRCVKPNENKQPKDISENLMKHQIKYLGLVENVRVRRAGFAYRREFAKFIQRYGIISKRTRDWTGAMHEGIKIIMETVNMDPNEWQMGKTKVFIKAPESLFMLEEMRDRRYNEYALILQKAFKKFNAVKYYHKLKLEASSIVLDKKERKRLTINRKFYADYIGLDNNPAIRALLVKREKVEFAQKCVKYDRQFKRQIRDLILTNRAIYIVGRKEVKENKRKVVVEDLKRRIEYQQIERIALSPYQDNFLFIFPVNDYATVLEIDYKTEFLTTLYKRYKEQSSQQLIIQFLDSIEFKIKKEGWGGGGTRTVKFNRDQTVKDVAVKTSGKAMTVSVPPGLPSSTKPTENYYTVYNFKSEPWWSKFEKTGIKIKSSTKPTTGNNQNQQGVAANVNRTRGEIMTNNISYVQNNVILNRQQQQQQQQQQQVKPPIQQRMTTKKPKIELNYPKCKALYDYTATDNDELSFQEGEIIHILQEDDHGWWKGICNGKTGLFPWNYIEKI